MPQDGPLVAQCTMEQIADAPMPKVVVEVVSLVPQERVQRVDLPVSQVLNKCVCGENLVPTRTNAAHPSVRLILTECVEVVSLVSQEGVQRRRLRSASHVERVCWGCEFGVAGTGGCSGVERDKRVSEPEVVSSLGAKWKRAKRRKKRMACDDGDDELLGEAMFQAAGERNEHLEQLMAVCQRLLGWCSEGHGFLSPVVADGNSCMQCGGSVAQRAVLRCECGFKMRAV